jgi:hypothetical protein
VAHFAINRGTNCQQLCQPTPFLARNRPIYTGFDTVSRTIRLHYPTLTIEQVYGAIAPEIKEKFARLRQQMLTRRS